MIDVLDYRGKEVKGYLDIEVCGTHLSISYIVDWWHDESFTEKFKWHRGIKNVFAIKVSKRFLKYIKQLNSFIAS